MTERRKHERFESDKLLAVFDRKSERQLGGLANLSPEGAMLITHERIKSLTVLQCRVELPHQILGRDEIIFDAECRWCRKNVEKGWWESGYKLSMSGTNKELVSYLSLSFALGKWGISGLSTVETAPVENLRSTTRYDTTDPLPVFEQHSYREIGGLANLSTQGAGLTTPKPVKKGKVLHCRVKLPKIIFQQDYLFFDAECMWCKKNDSKNCYESGYKLKSVSEQDAVIILHLIIHHLKEQPSRERIRVVR